MGVQGLRVRLPLEAGPWGEAGVGVGVGVGAVAPFPLLHLPPSMPMPSTQSVGVEGLGWGGLAAPPASEGVPHLPLDPTASAFQAGAAASAPPAPIRGSRPTPTDGRSDPVRRCTLFTDPVPHEPLFSLGACWGDGATRRYACSGYCQSRTPFSTPCTGGIRWHPQQAPAVPPIPATRSGVLRRAAAPRVVILCCPFS